MHINFFSFKITPRYNKLLICFLILHNAHLMSTDKTSFHTINHQHKNSYVYMSTYFSTKESLLIIPKITFDEKVVPISLELFVSSLNVSSSHVSENEDTEVHPPIVSMTTGFPQTPYFNLIIEEALERTRNEINQKSHSMIGLLFHSFEFVNEDSSMRNTRAHLWSLIEKFSKSQILSISKNYKIYFGNFKIINNNKSRLPIKLVDNQHKDIDSIGFPFHGKVYTINNMREYHPNANSIPIRSSTSTKSNTTDFEYSSDRPNYTTHERPLQIPIRNQNKLNNLQMGDIISKIRQVFTSKFFIASPIVTTSFKNDTHSPSSKSRKAITNTLRSSSTLTLLVSNSIQHPNTDNSDNEDSIECNLAFRADYKHMFKSNENKIKKELCFDYVYDKEKHKEPNPLVLFDVLSEDDQANEVNHQTSNTSCVNLNSKYRSKRRKSINSIEIDKHTHIPTLCTTYYDGKDSKNNNKYTLEGTPNRHVYVRGCSDNITSVNEIDDEDYSPNNELEELVKKDKEYYKKEGFNLIKEKENKGGNKTMKIVLVIVVVLSCIGIVLIALKIYFLYCK